jgi:hypothetical protein
LAAFVQVNLHIAIDGQRHAVAASRCICAVAVVVEHGALPRRDELTVRYAQWATSARARVSGDDHRDVVRRFIRWQLQRRMNRMETVPHGTFLRSK